MSPVPLNRKAVLFLCALFLFSRLPASAESVSRGPWKIDTLIRRADSIHALSGLVNIKIHTPTVKRKIKAAFLLTRKGYERIDGMSPFGSPFFHVLRINGGLLIQFPGSGLLCMDMAANAPLARFINFPGVDASLLELISGGVVTRGTRGKAVLSEVMGGKKFLISIDSTDRGNSRHVELNADFLPRRVDFIKGNEKVITIHYSRYRKINGTPFPFYSLFQTAKNRASIELYFKVVHASDALADEKFRVLLNPRTTFIGLEDLLKQIPPHRE